MPNPMLLLVEKVSRPCASRWLRCTLQTTAKLAEEQAQAASCCANAEEAVRAAQQLAREYQQQAEQARLQRNEVAAREAAAQGQAERLAQALEAAEASHQVCGALRDSNRPGECASRQARLRDAIPSQPLA